MLNSAALCPKCFVPPGATHSSLCAPAPLRFYLGTHQPHWLEDERFRDIPLFVSRRTLAKRKNWPRSVTRWALDSGGFTELQMFGRWTLSAAEYAAEARRFGDAIGMLDWSAPQDWMCEPQIIEGLVKRRAGCGGKKPAIDLATWKEWAREAGPVMAKSLAKAESLGDDAEIVFHGTGLSVEEHQRRTVANFLKLRALAPDLPIIPVLQGWTMADYWRCEDMYRKAGVDLRAEKLVGVGTVCRRQGTAEVTRIMRSLAAGGLLLHGFGIKQKGIDACGSTLVSADSLAWSYAARREAPIEGHDRPAPGRPKGHINCANCADYAIGWRARIVRRGQFDFTEAA